MLVAPSGPATRVDSAATEDGKAQAISELYALAYDGKGHDYRLDEAVQRVIDEAQTREFGRPLSAIEESDDGEYHPSTLPSSPQFGTAELPDMVINELPTPPSLAFTNRGSGKSLLGKTPVSPPASSSSSLASSPRDENGFLFIPERKPVPKAKKRWWW